MNRYRFGGIRISHGRTNHPFFFDGWMDDAILCPFNRISVISGRREERIIMKGCVQWNLVYGRKDNRLQQVSIPEQLAQQAGA